MMAEENTKWTTRKINKTNRILKLHKQAVKIIEIDSSVKSTSSINYLPGDTTNFLFTTTTNNIMKNSIY